MADNPAVSAAQTGYGTTAGIGAAVVSGLDSGANWAAKKADLDMQQKHLQMQQEQHQSLMDTHAQALGESMINHTQKYLREDPKSPTGKVRFENLVQINKASASLPGRSGKPIFSEADLASLQDEKYRPDWEELGGSLDDLNSSNPDGYKKLTLAFAKNLSPEDTYLTLGQQVKQIGMMKLAKAKAEATAANQEKNRDWRQTSKGQQQYDTETKGISFQLENINRVKKLITDGIKTGEIKTTGQIRHLLATEEERIVANKNNYAASGVSDLEQKSLVSKIGDMGNFLSGKQDTDTITPEAIDQIDKVYSLSAKEYHANADRVAQKLLGGATPAERESIIGRHREFQDTYGQAAGGWRGPASKRPRNWEFNLVQNQERV